MSIIFLHEVFSLTLFQENWHLLVALIPIIFSGFISMPQTGFALKIALIINPFFGGTLYVDSI